jgi:hypothetical protein
MSRAKTKRPSTKAGATPAPTRRIDTVAAETYENLDIAASAALDDMLPEQRAALEQLLPEPEPEPAPRALSASAEVIEETSLAEVPTLRFAVYEDAPQLAAARDAIAASGHVVAFGASGHAGLARVTEAVRNGTVDAALITLPGGEAVLDAAIALEPRRPVVIAAVDGSAAVAIKRATAAGADLATTRPHDAERLGPILLAAGRLHAERGAALSARGSEQVLRAKLEEISDSDGSGLQPFEVFQRVLELEIKRARRYEYALAVALFAVEIAPPPPPAGIRGILRARAGNALIQSIRDIDLATQLDHERFLVLLPYTDLSGAANLSRRVIAAVASGDPVVSGGRSFPPRVVGAVTGARPGEVLSFAKLMKEASRALEQARRDGAELAVQP